MSRTSKPPIQLARLVGRSRTSVQSRIVDLLVSSGVRLSVWHLPAELGESHDGAAISYDDLLEFHYAIQQEGWFERMVSSVGLEDQT